MTNVDDMRVRHRYEKARLKQYFHRYGTCTIALKLKILALHESVCRGELTSLSLANELGLCRRDSGCERLSSF